MAIRFDAAADRLSYSAVAPPATFTITAWAYLSVDQNALSHISRLWDGAAGGVVGWRTTADGTSGPSYFSGAATITNATGFVVDEWRKVAIARTGATAQSLVATPAGVTEVDSGAADTGTIAGITLAGRHPGSATEWWNGRLAYVRIWSAVLTQPEIEAEWASATPVRTADLFADWPLATSTDLTDTVASRVLTTVAGFAHTTEDGPPIGTDADAGHATGTGTAQASVAAIAPAAELSAGAGAAHDPTVTVVEEPMSGSWYGLLEILRTARAEAQLPHPEDDECPNDGTRYEVGHDGTLYCPFDGHRPGGRTS
jgi:hypothetical protein